MFKIKNNKQRQYYLPLNDTVKANLTFIGGKQITMSTFNNIYYLGERTSSSSDQLDTTG